MKWILTRQINHSDYWQLSGATDSIDLRYNQDVKSFRLNSGQKRLYFLEKTGFFQSRLLITTEYYVKAGECYFIKNRFAGILQVENVKYKFKVNRDHIDLSSKDKTAIAEVDIEALSNLDHFEFGALLFGFGNLQHLHAHSAHLNGTF